MHSLFLAGAAALALSGSAHAESWWNKQWTARKTITVDTTSNGVAVDSPVGGALVLVRLHDGNFSFASAKEDGSDLRFVAEDDKTLLPHQVERYDSLINEAFVWVKVPEVKSGGQTTFHVYYGSPQAAAEGKPSDTYDADSSLVYHFAERAGNPADATSNANNATNTATVSEGALIGSGLRLVGGDPVQVPASASLEWKANQALTWSAWVKASSLQARAVIFSRAEGQSGFRVLLDQGVPQVEVVTNGVTVSSGPGDAVAVGVWSHLAVVAEAGSVKLFVNGAPYGAPVSAGIPALNVPLAIGGLLAPVNGTERFSGEIDELEIAKVARPAGWVKFAALSQGTSDAAVRAVALGEEQGEGGGGHPSKALEHVMLFGDIAKNMMFDGWIAIGVCVIMIIVGWTVAAKKFVYLNSIQKGGKEFLRQWKLLSSDLTALDYSDASSVKSFGGNADPKTQALASRSPLYNIYHIGSEEIRHRLDRDKDRTKGLSGRSIQAIRAALDAGLVHESHRLTKGLVFLTISIAGGPYVGLLGTVVGVMITFAIIAKSGEVDVNSIAPGIASALLATVAGLIVAIPALFIYSYLNSRIKENTGVMQVFIDEFVAKMAEFYPPAGEASPHAPAATAERA